jgi:hypothetical protein
MKSGHNSRETKEQKEEMNRMEKYQKESATRTGELKREYEVYRHRPKWFLLPVVFGLIGGIIMFLEHAGTNSAMAKIGLLVGIVVSVSVLWAILHFGR